MLFVLFVIMLFVYPPLAFFILILGIGAKVLKKS
jgi:hypothetical protein